MVGKFTSVCLRFPPFSSRSHSLFAQVEQTVRNSDNAVSCTHSKRHGGIHTQRIPAYTNNSTYPVILSFTSDDDHSSQHRRVIYFILDNTFTCFAFSVFSAHSLPPHFAETQFRSTFLRTVFVFDALFSHSFLGFVRCLCMCQMWALHAQTQFVSSIQLII